jgi:hypothetical protein
MTSRFIALAGATFLATGAAFAQSPTPVAPRAAAPMTTAPAAGTVYVPSQASTEWLASKTMGANVYSPTDEKIGDIKDFVVDSSGSVRAVVLGVGGFLGMGEKDVAVATQSLRMTRDANGAMKIVLDATKDALKNAPTFQYSARS